MGNASSCFSNDEKLPPKVTAKKNAPPLNDHNNPKDDASSM